MEPLPHLLAQRDLKGAIEGPFDRVRARTKTGSAVRKEGLA
jgi:hypothetical protein